MEKIIVSACIFGKNTKYNGRNNYNPLVEELKKKYEIILICPEVMGGLSIPRNPSERMGDKVISNLGKDVTKEYLDGANVSLQIAKDNSILKAVLKDGSPSCGSKRINDGTFSHKKISGMGITAQIFKENGIDIYTEDEIEKLL